MGPTAPSHQRLTVPSNDLDASGPIEIHRMRERLFIVFSGKEGPEGLVAETPFMTNPEAPEPAERNQ